MNIDWNYPPPRRGLKGALDRFCGPGATRAEVWLQVVPALLAGLAAPAYAIFHHLGWSYAQLIVGALLALDLTGGIITNSTSSGKRWYHRPGQGFRQHLMFVAIHAVHVFVVAWLFRSLDWDFFGAVSISLLVFATVLLGAPLYLQRPLAAIFLALAFLLNTYIITPTKGLEWFVPFLFLKLLVSHLLKEEPYRPAGEQVRHDD
ncbi:MAG: hypothetical protein NTV79_07750 [Candidatus Aureabacteria bacterium]|nr:hypothetical protein [Candidatus Auribacterota bacterium]